MVEATRAGRLASRTAWARVRARVRLGVAGQDAPPRFRSEGAPGPATLCTRPAPGREAEGPASSGAGGRRRSAGCIGCASSASALRGDDEPFTPRSRALVRALQMQLGRSGGAWCSDTMELAAPRCLPTVRELRLRPYVLWRS